MKIFTLIFSIYILLLTGVPCCAFDKCEKEQPGTEQTTEEGDNSHDKKDCCGSCSPFFCHSCSGFVIPVVAYYTESVLIVYKKTYNLYASPFHPQYVGWCWRPPDIA